MAISKASWEVAQKLISSDGSAVLAGGAVRDILLGVEPRDLDVYCWVPKDEWRTLAAHDGDWFTYDGSGTSSPRWSCGIATSGTHFKKDPLPYGEESYKKGFISTFAGDLNVLLCNSDYYPHQHGLLKSFDCAASQFSAYEIGSNEFGVVMTKGAKLWFEERILWFKSGVSRDYVNKIVAKVPHREVRYANAKEWAWLSEVVK